MAKIGTAHIEIKPVLNEEAVAEIVSRIEDAVARGVRRGMAAHLPVFGDMRVTPARLSPPRSAADAEVIATAIRNRAEHYRGQA